MLDPLLLYYCTVPDIQFCLFLANSLFSNTGEPSGIRVASLNPAHSFVIRSECSFRGGCPRELPHSPSYSKRVLDLGRVPLGTARPPENYNSQI